MKEHFILCDKFIQIKECLEEKNNQITLIFEEAICDLSIF